MFVLNESSEKKLLTVQPAMKQLVKRAAELSTLPFQIVQGNRTQAEQDAIYNQGRFGHKGPIVTWTRNSNHIGGRAIDFAALVDGKIDWETISRYQLIATYFKKAAEELKIPINWGGDWHTKDYGHIELQKGVVASIKPPISTITIHLDQIIRKGDKGPAVLKLQQLLNDHGLHINEDSDFGPVTDAAVRAFQANHHLTVDGIVGTQTWPLLLLSTPPTVPLPVPDPITKLDHPHFVKKTLEDLGWKDFQAAAMVGQAMRESYPDLRPTVWGDDPDGAGPKPATAFGIWQHRGTRLINLEKFAASLGKPITDLETQAKFADWELHNTHKWIGDALAITTNIDEALRVAIGFEGPRGYSKAHPENGDGWYYREKYAKSLLT